MTTTEGPKTGYEKYKNDPFVKFLLKYFDNNSKVSIPGIWQRFISQSTPESDINLLLAQLQNWGIENPTIDVNLRGNELLQAILDSRLAPIFTKATELAEKNGLKWPEALELALSAKGHIPSKATRDMIGTASMHVNGDLIYTETGTVRYEVVRRIPDVSMLVPPSWILRYCGPEVSDNDMVTAFTNAHHRGFAPMEHLRAGGFSLRECWKKIFRKTPTSRWDRDKMTSSMEGIFPKQIQISRWDDEPPATMHLLECRRSAMKTDEDVDRRAIHMDWRRDSRNRDRMTNIRFPVCNNVDGQRVPESKLVYRGYPRVAIADQDEDWVSLITALRNAYDTLAQASNYDDARKQALR